MKSTASPAVQGTPENQRTDDAGPQGLPAKWSISDRWAWAYSLPVSGIARAVAGVIAFHANDHTGLSWPGMGTIAEETGFGRTAVIKAIKELERGGHVSVTRLKVGKKNTSNRYRLPPMGNVSVSPPSAPDALGGSASDGPELVRTEPVSTTPPPAAAPEHLTAIEGGHGVQCRRCQHSWPRASGLSHICVGRSERKTEQPQRTRRGGDIGQQEVRDHQSGTAGPHPGRAERDRKRVNQWSGHDRKRG